MFAKILIANRGEIACRIVATCRRLGVRTVAVFSDADAGALHVRLADEAVRIGPPPARDSYLRAEAILDAATATGAEAVHPGYGFLSENAAFAEACARAGLVFIGPPPEAIRAMGSKAEAKRLMERAGVPLVPGYHGDEQDAGFLREQASSIGYPLMIKASAGGGGKGMRIVRDAAEFDAALASCRREAAASFGADRVILEKYLERPRHIEIQVFADAHGNVVHLFERDCSVQRRHQKVVEEAPAPGMTAERRAAMGRAACDAAQAVGYLGAGTVEFIVSQEGTFHFMEMNTRLQVEHPVTEMITGQDLVEWQLRVAAGERLPLPQERLAIHGHALEARLYAEDPAREFTPSTGRLAHLRFPTETPNIRVDAGVGEGDSIGPFYDPMMAKLIVWGEDRERARAGMLDALSRLRIAGVAHNGEFLARLFASPAFAAADLDTGLIERERAWLFPDAAETPEAALFLVALGQLLSEQRDAKAAAAGSADRFSLWHARDGWRLGPQADRSLRFRAAEGETEVRITYVRGGAFLAERDGSATRMRGELTADGTLRARLGDRQFLATWIAAGEKRYLFLEGRTYVLAFLETSYDLAEGAADHRLTAPMPGRVVALVAEPGPVAAGAPLLVMEAMKMEHTIRAPAAGVLKAFHRRVGDQVEEGADLVDFEPDASVPAPPLD